MQDIHRFKETEYNSADIKIKEAKVVIVLLR